MYDSTARRRWRDRTRALVLPSICCRICIYIYFIRKKNKQAKYFSVVFVLLFFPLHTALKTMTPWAAAPSCVYLSDLHPATERGKATLETLPKQRAIILPSWPRRPRSFPSPLLSPHRNWSGWMKADSRCTRGCRPPIRRALRLTIMWKAPRQPRPALGDLL